MSLSKAFVSERGKKRCRVLEGGRNHELHVTVSVGGGGFGGAKSGFWGWVQILVFGVVVIY